jgi:hypothetical protein
MGTIFRSKRRTREQTFADDDVGGCLNAQATCHDAVNLRQRNEQDSENGGHEDCLDQKPFAFGLPSAVT